MTDLSTAPVSTQSASLATRGGDSRLRETAEAFEASFLAQMMKPMFEGVSTEAPFGGGEAETTWRSFLLDAMAKKTVQSGGIGLTNTVMAEMLKMQEQSA